MHELILPFHSFRQFVPVAAAALLVPATTPQQADGDVLSTAMETIVERVIDEHRIPGVAVSVAFGPDVYFARGWGYADPILRETADAESPFRAGSFTVQLAAVAALQLVAAGELELDQELSTLLPAFAEEGAETAGQVELQHLLAHTSGLVDYAEYFERTRGARTVYERDEIVRWIAGEALEFTPGSCVSYNQTNTLLLGLIIEESTGRTFAEHATLTLFEPLEMENTRYCYDEPSIDEYAATTQEVAGELVEEEHVPRPLAALGLCTSARDLTNWVRALVEHRIIDSEGHELMTTAMTIGGRPTATGFGVNRTHLGDTPGWSFGGGMAGSRLHAAHYPAFDLTIAVLASDEAAPVDVIERKLARLVFEIPDPEVQDLELSAEKRALYIGGYNEGCTRLAVEERDQGLWLSSPYTEPYRLMFQGFDLFVSAEDPDVRVRFAVQDGRARSLELDERGVYRYAVRMD